MEFLMTYGWAIMVVLIAIGALAYFGVLSPDKFVPRKCFLEAGIGCTDFKVNENSVTVTLRNGKGEDITVTSIKVKDCTGTSSGILKNGEQITFIIDGCDNIPDTKFVGDVNITYTAESGLTHKNIGSVVDRVEGGRYTTVMLSDGFEDGVPSYYFGTYSPNAGYLPVDAYAGWTVVMGNWIIQDGYLKNNWGEDIIILNSPSSEPGKAIRAKVKETYHAIYPNFILGYQDSNNFYRLYFSWGYGWGGSLGWIKIVKVVDGEGIELAQTESSVQLVQDQWYQMEFRWVSPTKLEGELWDLEGNSLATVEATVSEGWTTGNYGLSSIRGTSKAWFDDVEIRVI